MLVLSLLFTGGIRAQDSIINAQLELADQLYARHILSATGRDEVRKWVESLRNSESALAGIYTRDGVPDIALEKIEAAARAYRNLGWVNYLSDSLQRAGLIPKLEDRSEKAQDMRWAALNAMRFIEAQRPPPGRVLPPQRFEWLECDTAFAQEIRWWQFNLEAVDTTWFQRKDLRGLLHELLELNLIDGLLYNDVGHLITCRLVADAAALIICIDQTKVERAGALSRRAERLARIKGSVEAGFMDSVAAERIVGPLGPYDSPSDFDIAVASSPHLVVPCGSYDTSTELTCTNVLSRIGAIVSELRPTDLLFDRTMHAREYRWEERDTLLQDTIYKVMVSFTNASHRYSFYTWEGGSQDFVLHHEPSSCWVAFNMMSALNKALCDAGSRFRLDKVENQSGDCGDFYTSDLAYVFMDRERCQLRWPVETQRTDVLGGLTVPKTNMRCAQMFATTFCRDSVQALVEQMGTLGLLQHLNHSAIDSSLQKAGHNFPASWADVLCHFPGLIASPGVLTEPWEPLVPWGPGVIKKQLVELATISHGKVRITDVKERWTGSDVWPRITASFTINGQRIKHVHGSRFIKPSMMLEDETMLRINHALMEQGVDGRYCSVISDRNVNVIFLGRAQYDALNSRILSRYYGDPWKPDISRYLER